MNASSTTPSPFKVRDSFSAINMSNSKIKSVPSQQHKQSVQQNFPFGNQIFAPKIKYETFKKFIPSPELIVDSGSESNEQFIMKNHHHEMSVSENSTI